VASIDKRPNGTYRARWREYPGGPQKTQTFSRKVDAERHLVSVQHNLLSGTYTPPEAGRVTVAAYAADWITRRTWAPSTEERIRREMRLHILPKLGDRPLASLRRAQVEEWANGLDLAASSARMVFETLSNMLEAAVVDERIPKNPAKGAHAPTSDDAPFVPLTVEQVRAITLRVVEHVRAGVLVVAGTGLRQGELFGLTVDRVDFMRRELRVDRQLFTPGNGRPFLKPPKSRNSYRTVSLSPVVIDAIAAHVASFGTGEDGVVFHIDGRPVSRSMASKYIRTAVASADEAAIAAWAKAGAKADSRPAELAGNAWHDIRHYHASSLLSEGVNPSKVAERLGHDLKTLLATYAHVMPRDDDRVRGIVDATLGERAEDWLRTAAS
jgi:integrase